MSYFASQSLLPWNNWYNPVRKAQSDIDNQITASFQEIENNRNKKPSTNTATALAAKEDVDYSPGWNVLTQLALTPQTPITVPYRETSSSDPRGFRNNNWLNIRLSANNNWQGKIKGTDTAFETFDTPEHGIRAAAKLVTNYYNSGLDTVDKIISRWAPSSENNTQNYINIVASRMNVDPNKKIDVKDPKVLENLLSAMTFVENGKEGDRNVIRRGIQLNV